MGSAPGLSFPRETFAKLTPGPFLHAHLKQPVPLRPNGRKPNECRQPSINTGSLTHSQGSAVVRLGDTAIVCGIRGEILKASDIPHPPGEHLHGDQLIEQLGLLVPNLELSTGCSPAYLPGNPPGSVAQTLTYRLSSLLYSSNLIPVSDLSIVYTEPELVVDAPGEIARINTKAYWTLYFDILCIALDGNAFEAAWLAIIAALKNVVLPKAWWDPDTESIVCSPLLSDSFTLHLAPSPIASAFSVFTTASPLKKQDSAEAWLLADPDAFEEEVCAENITVVLLPVTNGENQILRLEKAGGTFVGREVMQKCIEAAKTRCQEIVKILELG